MKLKAYALVAARLCMPLLSFVRRHRLGPVITIFPARERRRSASPPLSSCFYSHSMVAGGFDVTSRTTRFTAGISFTIRDETSSIRS